jgi:two-component system, cell cycle sensor histidine kinase PleC
MTQAQKIVLDRRHSDAFQTRLTLMGENDALGAIARLSHELRTPLGAALSFAEIMRDEHFGPLGSARYRQYAGDISDALQHAIAVIDRMAAEGDARSLQASASDGVLDLEAVVTLAATLVRGNAERAGIRLVMHVEPNLPPIKAEHSAITQILLNLLGNAVKFTPPQARITIEALRLADGRVSLAVVDTGAGIPPEDLVWMRAGASRPLERMTADRAQGDGKSGLGLGLPLCFALAAAQGAKLDVNSAVGVGTRVALVFGIDRVASADVRSA